jgi:hypothetical protein
MGRDVTLCEQPPEVLATMPAYRAYPAAVCSGVKTFVRWEPLHITILTISVLCLGLIGAVIAIG